MSRLRDVRGFTLLEVMITMVILAIGLLGLAGLQIMAIKGNSFGQQTTLASTLAQNKLEEMRETTYVSVANGNDTYSDQVNGVTYTRQWIVQDDIPQADMKTVRVQVSWAGPMADRSVTLFSIISAI